MSEVTYAEGQKLLARLGAQEAVRQLLAYLGEDVTREGLLDTPKRMVKALVEMTDGYGIDLDALFTVFESSANEMVGVREIPFTSLCEHHVLPFTGTATIAYIPSGKVLGLSKFSRVLDAFAHRLQIQEQLTEQVCECIDTRLAPIGCAVRVTAVHSCMTCRGIRKSGATMVTTALRGAFKTDPATRAEFFSLVNGGK